MRNLQLCNLDRVGTLTAWLTNCLQVTDIVHLISGVMTLICGSGDRCQFADLLSTPRRVRGRVSWL